MNMVWHNNETVYSRNCFCILLNHFANRRKLCVGADVVIGPYDAT